MRREGNTHAHFGSGSKKGDWRDCSGPPRTRPAFPDSGTRQRQPRDSLCGARRGRAGSRRGREGGTRGGRRARAARQEAQSRRLVTARLKRSRVRPGTGRQAAAAPPGSRGARRRGWVPLPHPRAPRRDWMDSRGSRCGDHLSVQGQDRNSASGVLRTGKFLIDKVLPSPHARLQNETKTQRERLKAPSPGPPWPAPPQPPGRPLRLGPGPGTGELARPRAPSAGGRQQAGPAGRLDSGPARGAQLSRSRAPAGSGGGAGPEKTPCLLGL